MFVCSMSRNGKSKVGRKMSPMHVRLKASVHIKLESHTIRVHVHLVCFSILVGILQYISNPLGF